MIGLQLSWKNKDLSSKQVYASKEDNMESINPKRLILIGFCLVLLGFVLPFLMVLQIVETTFFLSFLSWGSTTSGLMLGIVGAAQYVRLRKK